MYQLSLKSLKSGLNKMNQEFPIYLPRKNDFGYQFVQIAPHKWEDQFWFDAPLRTPQPLKAFFFPPAQKIAEYPGGSELLKNFQPAVIVGAKACDINALRIIDKVFAEGDFPDPYYLRAREQHILLSTDCLQAGEFCYCTLLNYQPYPKQNFDLNLSRVDDQYLVEIGSDRGKRILQKYFGQLEKASDSIILQREKMREELTEQVKRQNEEFSYFESHQHAIDNLKPAGTIMGLNKQTPARVAVESKYASLLNLLETISWLEADCPEFGGIDLEFIGIQPAVVEWEAIISSAVGYAANDVIHELCEQYFKN